MKITSTVALLLGALAFSAGLAGCGTGDQTDMLVGNDLSIGDTGSLRLALQAGDRVITTVTAVIEGKNGFQTQTHDIDVQGSDGVISIFFGDLPVGKKYRITLTAADCSGSATFNVTANQVSLVNVPLTCGGSESDSTGSVQVTGTIDPNSSGGGSDCDHVLKIVAAPSIQNGSGPVSQIELFLNDDVNPTTIQWTSSSTNGAAGTIGDLSGTTDKKVSFDCSANGTVFVSANVTAPTHHNSCTEQARVSIQCTNQGGTIPNSTCGNGVIENGPNFGGIDEVCDTNGANPDVLPAGSPVGSTCNATCTAVVSVNPGAVCGNGVIETGEVCDTNGANPDVLPAGSPAGSVCNATCTTVVTINVAVCGNGVIEAGETCDTNGANPDVLPANTTPGSTCNATCTAIIPPNPPPACGNGVIDSGEACDTNGANPDVLPAGTPANSTCNATCTAIVTVSVAVCGNGVIETGEACDTNGANPDVLPAGTPAGSTCNTTCTAIVGTPPPGVCLACALAKCPTQYNDAIGTTSDAANLADVTQLFDCVISPNWEAGGAIPSTSCFFADPGQPGGSLVPCYCGPTPVATCLASGPANNTQACGRQVEIASRCSPVSASCVTGSGSNPAVPLGDALQLLNCERAACQAECGFPTPPQE